MHKGCNANRRLLGSMRPSDQSEISREDATKTKKDRQTSSKTICQTKTKTKTDRRHQRRYVRQRRKQRQTDVIKDDMSDKDENKDRQTSSKTICQTKTKTKTDRRHQRRYVRQRRKQRQITSKRCGYTLFRPFVSDYCHLHSLV